MTIHEHYDRHDRRYYELDDETHDAIYSAIHDGLVASKRDDVEGLVDAIACLAHTFSVKIRKSNKLI